MSDQTILQPSLASDERSIVFDKLTQRFKQLDLSKLMLYLFDITEESALVHLAEQLSLFNDGWEMAESDDAKRNLLKSAIQIHKRKGTPWAIREVFRMLGLGEIELIEGTGSILYDGAAKYDGTYYYGDDDKWATYVVRLNQPVTRDQAASIREILSTVARWVCELVTLDYTESANRYNGQINYDGQYSYGVA